MEEAQSEIQTPRSDSPVPSCVSMKSQESMDQPLALKDRDPTFGHSQIQTQKPDPPEPSCVSMKSQESMDQPLALKDGQSQIQALRSTSPEPSCVSMKSQESMDQPLALKDGDPTFGYSQIQAQKPDSPAPSCVSMKSQESMDQPLALKDRNPTFGHSQIQAQKPDPPEPSCVSMKSQESMDQPLALKDRDPTFGHSFLQKSLDSPEDRLRSRIQKQDQTRITDTRRKVTSAECECCKINLKQGLQQMNDITNQANPTLLSEIYTELYITEGDISEVNSEHEVRQIEAAFGKVEEIPIKCNDIFKSLSEENKLLRTVLTKGVAGIGKTVSVQKFILDWAEGKANQDIDLIFPLPFRELNLLRGQKLSVMELLPKCCKEIDISGSAKVLFVLDGLDECRFPLDFQNSVRLSDVTDCSSVDVLLVNLIKGNLLSSALIWITSRPAATDQIPSDCVDRVTEVRGFTDPQKEEYISKRISDQSLASRIISHLKSSRSLYIMCHIPVFCWISATVLERLLGETEGGEIPKTLTQMYTHFLNIQINVLREKYTKRKDDTIFKLGRLAFQQLMKGNLIFYGEDIKKCGIDVGEAAVYSGVLTQIFREETGVYQNKIYSFVHLSIQEHLAALYVHLTFINQKINVLDQGLWLKMKSRWKSLEINDLHKSAVDKAFQSKNGHLDLFLRFLLGLSLESNQSILQGLLTLSGSSSYRKEETVQYVKKMIRKNPSPQKSINLFHCLNELNDHSLVEEIQRYVQSGNLQQEKLSSSQWAAIVFVLLTSYQEQNVFDLRKYISQSSETGLNMKTTSDEVLQKLLPVVSASTTAQLHNCSLTHKSCTVLASVLSSASSSLRELDLSENTLGDSGVELLSAVVESPHSKLEILRLQSCGITYKGCVNQTSCLRSTPLHLRKLDLSKNKLGDSGAKYVSAIVENSLCKMEMLRLCDCNITYEGCADLATALRSNFLHIRELDLSENKLEDSGVKILSFVIENSLCKMEILRLRECNITDEGCADLASALQSNPSHLRELHLSWNKLGKSGVERFTAAVKNSNCKLIL